MPRIAAWAALLVIATAVLGLPLHLRASTLLVDDSLLNLNNPARFHVSGGAFQDGGWKVTNKNDYIIWHIPRTTTGAIEFDVKGINPRECGSGIQDLTEIFHMYDNTWFNSDFQYGDPGYRNNPYKHFIRKSSAGYFQETSPGHWDFIDCRGHAKTDSMEILWKLCPNNNVSCENNYAEPDTSILGWNAATTYHFCESWEFNGTTTTFRIYRDGAQLLTGTFAGQYACGPGGEPYPHSLRIAASNRGNEFAGAPVGAVFSNFKAWSGPFSCTCPMPGAPSITRPAVGETFSFRLGFIQWTGGAHAQYQVQVNTANSPDASVVWDSGQVQSDRNFAWTGLLPDQANYYAFVRLNNCGNWGPWSPAGRWFRVDTTAPPPSDRVELWGHSLKDGGGPFLGLGATYMSALYWAKHDRTRLRTELGTLAPLKFDFIRILGEVGGGCGDYWEGREITPFTFTNQNNCVVPAWPDYLQQLRDLLDIVYDEFGMRTEITIFGSANISFKDDKPKRQAMLDLILQAVAGREHKVILIEVGNEAWQNGFSWPQGLTDLREFGAYLAARTSIPIALTSPWDTSNAGIEELYCGSAADIATVHFSRDLSPDGGWLPVYDSYRLVSPCVPPMSSNEPVGPGSSVSSENNPIKLCMAAAVAWGANLPMYVYHTRAGVRGDLSFASMDGKESFLHLKDILPPDFSSWIRNDGVESTAPFTTLGGAVRHTGSCKGNEFITLPIGISSGGVVLEPRRSVWFNVYDPLTGVVLYSSQKEPGERFTLPQGPKAYIIKGQFVPSRLCLSDDFANPGAWSGLVPGSLDVAGGMLRITGGATNLYASRAAYCQDPGTGVIRAAVKIRRGTGDDTCWGLWFDDPAGKNLARWYGSGTTARGRIGSTADVTETQTLTGGWDSLVISIDPAENTSEFFFNGASIGTLNHAPLGGSDVIGQVRFERIGNSEATGQYAEFDNLVLGEPDIPADFDDDDDVDQDDFGVFQACLTGSGKEYSLYCGPADLDKDGDVDSVDLGVFRQCMNGANREPGC